MLVKLSNNKIKELNVNDYVILDDDLLYKIIKVNNEYRITTDMNSEKACLEDSWYDLDDLVFSILPDLCDIINDVQRASFKIEVDAYYDTTISIPNDIEDEEIYDYIRNHIDKLYKNELKIMECSDLVLDSKSLNIYDIDYYPY